MNNQPLISIVTPTYNSGEYLEECILSIKNQTYTHFEHIIIDAVSTDDTLDIIKKYHGQYNMKYISEPDNGMYQAIVKGLSMARGEILVWLNSDDMYFRGALEIMADVMSRQEVLWCTGLPSKYNKSGVNYGISRHAPVYIKRFLEKGYYDGRILSVIQQESVFWKRELLEKVDWKQIANYQYAGDYLLWLLFSQKTGLYTIDCVLSGFRKHQNQKSHDIAKYREEQEQIMNYGKVQIILKKIHFYKFVSIINSLFGKSYYIKYQDILK